MHLKRLELRGFKSFAKGIEIQFQPGINVIVGPNGCGKSNIADAIRWVLGEANVRHLRGQRGEDVIFTGTDKKRPLGMASVSMTLDNQDRMIDSDYAELSITRRIYRSGESEFMINMADVRLKDIQQLFAGTGLGKRGYSVIGQGELEQVLDARPFERRLILEEAAGLSGYRQKKEEAEAKLASSVQDLVRLEDILGEVSQRLLELEGKAARACEFLALNDELIALEREILAHDVFWYQRELEDIEREHLELAEKLAEIQVQNDEEERSFRELTGYVAEVRQQSSALKERRHQLTSGLARQESEIRLSRERIEHARDRLTQMEHDIARNREMMERIESDLEASSLELALKEAELEEKSREVQSLAEEMKTVEEEREKSALQMERCKTELIDLLSLEASINTRIRERETRLGRNREKLELGKTENQYRRQRVEQWKEELADMDYDLARGQEALNRMEQEKKGLEEERDQRVQEMRESQVIIDSLHSNMRELNKQVLTLEESIRSHVGFSEGVRRLVKAVKSEPQLVPGFLGVVIDLLEVPPGLETAIEAAAGRSLENIVVKGHEDARRAINLLKFRSWGRATFLPLKILRPQMTERRLIESLTAIPGVLGLATDLVRFAPEYRKAIDHVLGRVLIVDNLDTGLQVYRKNTGLRIVTLEGETINPTGAMTGGRQQKSTLSTLQLKASHREKSAELEKLNRKLKDAESRLGWQKSSLLEIESRMSKLQQQVSEKAFQQEMLRKERERVVADIAEAEGEVAQFDAEHGMIFREMETLESELGDLNRQLVQVQAQIQTAQEQMEECRSEADQLLRRLELIKERHLHCCDLVNLRQRELDGRRQGLQQLVSVKESYDSTLNEYEQQVARFNSVADRENRRIEDLEREKVILLQELNDTATRLAGLEEELAASQSHCQQREESLRLQGQFLMELKDKVKSQEIKRVRAETEVKNARMLWEERFGEEALPPPREFLAPRTQRSLRDRLQEIRGLIERLGPVDVEAVAELEQVQQRFGFLRDQIEDLRKARRSLNRVIEETESIMTSRFRDFLTLANASFKNTFNSIFKGGEADLLLEDHENPWQAGVDIMVKMPGKRRQLLNLLSGGERALTCIAFIFSLLVLRPTPFCLFDEIDAALDDANLRRFVDFLKQLGDRMQFIVITHRQGTIEAGHTIFGVTMPEQGMSEVYSLTSQEAEALAG